MSLTTQRSDASPPETQPAGGDRFVATALLTLTALLAGYQVIAGHVIPPLALFAVLFAVSGTAVWRWRGRWPSIVAGAIALLYLGGSVRFFVANLAHPESPVSFLAEVFLLVGLVTLLIGVVMGLRGAGPGDRRPIAIGALVVASLAVAVSVVATLRVDSETRQADDVAIAVERSTFPEAVATPAGATTLWVDNQDPFHHTIVIEGTDVRAVLPGSTAIRVPVDLEPGTYRYLCDVPGHESMVGELHVR